MNEIDNKFVSFKGKESLFQEIKTPRKIIFHPFFCFVPSYKEDPFEPDLDRGKRYVYRINIKVNSFNFSKLQKLEDPDRYDGYGFWSITCNSKVFIGLSAKTLEKALESFNKVEANFVIVYPSEILIIITLKKETGNIGDVYLKAYISNDCGTPYVDNIRLVKHILSYRGLIEKETELKGQEIEITHKRYFYSKKIEKRDDFLQKATHNEEKFLKYVRTCIWYIVDSNKRELDTPYLVLLKNPNLKSNTFLDKISSFLVWRQGGFVLDDFIKETKFIIREVDKYSIENLTILDVECYTSKAMELR